MTTGELAATARVSREQLRQLDLEGYVVLPDVIGEEECDEWARLVDEAWERERTKPRDFDPGPGVQFVPNLLLHSPEFERCVSEQVVVEAVRRVLGPDVRFSLANARRTDPGYGNQPLHDLNRRRGRPFLLCDAIWCIDEFTESNGTRVLPGSHLSDERFLARMRDPQAPHPDERVVVAPRGSVVVLNGALIHAGNTNRSHRPRRSIQTQFCLPGHPTKYDWPALPASIRERLSPESRELLALA
jgi:Phytanoyl-CoA dioxygenase (PhyH)